MTVVGKLPRVKGGIQRGFPAIVGCARKNESILFKESSNRDLNDSGVAYNRLIVDFAAILSLVSLAYKRGLVLLKGSPDTTS